MPVIAAAAVASYDILTIAEAYAVLNITTATDQAAVAAELAAVNSAASVLVDSIDGAVVERTVTDTFTDPGQSVILSTYPIVAVTTATSYSSGAASSYVAESNTTAGDYRVDLATGIVSARSGFGATWFTGQALSVTYVAGRFPTTATVEPIYKAAAGAALTHLWQMRGAQNGAATFGGDGAPFGGVPFSTMQLRKQLAAMLKHDPVPGLA